MRLGVVHEQATAGRGVREEPPVRRPGWVEVRALLLRHYAIDPVALEVEDEDVEDALFVTSRERDLRLVGTRAEARCLVVLALKGDALGAAAARRHHEDLRRALPVGHECDLRSFG